MAHPQTPAAAAGREPGPLTAAAQLAGLWALAIAQPLFEILAPGEELVLFNWTGADVVGFALALVALPPALLVGLELAAGRLGDGARRGLHVAFVGGLAGVLAMYVARSQADASDGVLVACGLAAGLGAALAWGRFRAFRSLLTLLAVAPVASAALFLLASPAARLVLPEPPGRPAASAAATPVAVVVFDEFPSLSLVRADGRLDAGAYPNFASLAADATWFRNATTPYDFTRISVPAILTGRRVQPDTPPSLAGHPRNLFTLLGRSHAVHALEQVTRICPASDCPNNAPASLPGRVARPLPALARVSAATFLPHALLRRLPATHPLGTRPPTPQPARFVDMAERIATERRPGLFYLHASTPHGPWYHLPSGQTYPLTGCCADDVFPGATRENSTGLAVLGPDRWTANGFLVAQARQRHLAQARFADRLLGRLLASLRASGKYERALVIVTADHGIDFQAGQHARRLSPGNLVGTLGVPLFVKAPFQRRGRVDDAFARTTDIVPTVTDVLGLGDALDAEGSSLLGPSRRPPAGVTAYGVLDGRSRRFSPAAFLAQRDRLLRSTLPLFGPRPASGLFSFGPRRRLIGRPVRELRRLPIPRGRVRIDAAARFVEVDPGAAAIPAHLSGVLAGIAPGSNDLAVELNGRIAATTRPYRSSAGGVRFSALLPASFFRQGRNAVRIHAVVVGPRATLALRPLAQP